MPITIVPRNYSLDASKVLNYQGYGHDEVGFLLSCQFQGTDGYKWKADESVKQPDNPDTAITVVGALEGLEWDGAQYGIMHVRALVTEENYRGFIAAKQTENTLITFGFCIWGYDTTNRKFYKRFYGPITGDALNGDVVKGGRGSTAFDFKCEQTATKLVDEGDAYHLLTFRAKPDARSKDQGCNFAAYVGANTGQSWGPQIQAGS